MFNHAAIRNRFGKLWARQESAAGEVADPFPTLLKLYGGAGRYYHNFAHIEHCLSVFDGVQGSCRDRDAVELAIWFHDAVYEMGAADNELQSARLFIDQSGALTDDNLRERVYELIIATDHRYIPAGDDERLLADIDLSSFGLNWQRFRDDCINVRNEMSHLPDSQFYPGQIRFMNALLDRDPLFVNRQIHADYESQARSNINRYRMTLADRGFETDREG